VRKTESAYFTIGSIYGLTLGGDFTFIDKIIDIFILKPVIPLWDSIIQINHKF
jgi:hypothetical protein